MERDQRILVRETWRRIEPIGEQAAVLFYDRLFQIDPTLRRLFKNSDMPQQHRKLIQALSAVVRALDHLDSICPMLEALGRRHLGYGVTAAHYESVGAALLGTLEKAMDEAWTGEVETAWSTAYGLVADAMQKTSALPPPLPAQRPQPTL